MLAKHVGSASFSDVSELILGIACIFGVCFCAYFPALNAGFVWDDPEHFGPGLMHPSLAGLKDLWVGHRFYYPLTSTTFWMIRSIWDMNPFPYHLLNIILHAINSILLWRIVKRLGMKWPFICGLIFAIHPVHVQSVAWATELKNTQSGLFYLWAMLLYLDSEQRGCSRRYGWALVLYLASLLSKTSTVTFPFVLAVLHLWRGGRMDKKSIIRLAPFFALSFAMGGLTVLFHQEQVTTLDYWDETFFQRLLLASRCIWFYLQKLMWPAALIFVYPRWDLSSDFVMWIGFSVALLLLTGLLWQNRSNNRWRRAALFGFAGFIASLLPVLNIFKMYYTRFSYTADHWQYLADIVVIPVLVGLFAGLFGSFHMDVPNAPQLRRGIRNIFLGLIVLGFVLKSAIQCADYKDIEALWRNTLRKNPMAYLAHVNLALHLTDLGEYDEAYELYEAAVTLDSDPSTSYLGLGRIEYLRENYSESEAMYQKILDYSPDNVDALNGIAGIRVKEERYGKAMELIKRALEINPKHADSYTNQGRLYDAIGKREEAIAAYTRAIDLNPKDSKSRQHLGDDLRLVGRYEEAAIQYSFSLQLDPKNVDAAFALGALQGGLGDFEGALEVFLRAREQAPENAGLAFNIGVTLKKLGRDLEAESYLAEAARLDPMFGESTGDGLPQD